MSKLSVGTLKRVAIARSLNRSANAIFRICIDYKSGAKGRATKRIDHTHQKLSDVKSSMGISMKIAE